MAKQPKKPKKPSKPLTRRRALPPAPAPSANHDSAGRFARGNKQGGPRPNSGRKPKEITDLHTQLFNPELAEAAARVLKAKLLATTPEIAEAFAIIQDRLATLDPTDQEGKNALATIAGVAIAANQGALDAAEYVCDRMFGKPKQAIQADGVVELVITYEGDEPEA